MTLLVEGQACSARLLSERCVWLIPNKIICFGIYICSNQDMLAAAKDKLEQEKQWLLSKIGLIPDHDDGKYLLGVSFVSTALF